MRIIIILEYFYNLGRPIGGAERQLAKLARKLTDAGVDVTLLCGQWKRGEPRHEIIDGLSVHRVFTCWAMFELKGLRKFGHYIYLFSLFMYLFRHRKQYDFIHCHSALASAYVVALAGRLLDKKTLARPMASGPTWGDLSRLRREKGFFGAEWMFKQYRHLDCVIALNEEVISELEAIGVNRANIVRMPNGVETEGISPKTSYHLMGNTVKMTYVGRLNSQKGLEPLLAALKNVITSHPQIDWQLQLLGKGELRDRLEAEAHNLDIAEHVKFFGQVPDVFPILYESDIFILPSRAEGMSNALLEAMTCALPCIASDIPANAQIIDHGQNGLLVQVDNAQDLAQAISTLGQDQILREKLGQAAAQTIAKHYDINRVTERYVALYQRVLKTNDQ